MGLYRLYKKVNKKFLQRNLKFTEKHDLCAKVQGLEFV